MEQVNVAIANVTQASVETETSAGQTLQTAVSERQVKELPTINRNPYALVQLAGTAIDVDPLNQNPSNNASSRSQSRRCGERR